MPHAFRLPDLRLRRARSAALGLLLAASPAAWAAPADPPDGGSLYARAVAALPAAAAIEAARGPKEPLPSARIRHRNVLVVGSGAALVAAYGLSHWWQDGFGGGFKTTNEGWFGRGTAFGGADKLGHVYSNYAGVRLLTPLFELAGNDREAAVGPAAWSTLGIFTGVEVLDGFSRHWKFSAQDAIANAAGTLLGVALERHPDQDALLDLRVDYRPSEGSSFDPFGDYSGQKYLLVFKADAFARLRQHPALRYLEFAVGYGTRGYDNGGDRHRDLYLGVSVNLARLLADVAYKGQMHSTPLQRGTDRVFELIQFPSVGYGRHSVD